jgi:dCTP deaminase
VILSDRDIRAALQRHDDPLIVDPGFDPRRLQPASLELTLAADVLVDMGEAGVHPSTLSEDATLRRGQFGLLHPGCFVLASTLETVRIPTDLVAQVNGKSSHGRRGLVIHQTAGFIDPGFRGQITLELHNVSLNPFRLTLGMPICQLVFFQMTSPAERPFGTEGLGSHFMGQQGPTSARV